MLGCQLRRSSDAGGVGPLPRAELSWDVFRGEVDEGRELDLSAESLHPLQFLLFRLYFHVSFHIKSASSLSLVAGAGTCHYRWQDLFSSLAMLHRLVVFHVGFAQEVRIIQPELPHKPNHSFRY